jgi:hypothetical protein
VIERQPKNDPTSADIGGQDWWVVQYETASTADAYSSYDSAWYEATSPDHHRIVHYVPAVSVAAAVKAERERIVAKLRLNPECRCDVAADFVEQGR